MNKIFVAIAFLLLGLIGGSTCSKYFMRQHQHATSVMWLSQFHFDRFAAAVRGNDCATGSQEAQALQFFAHEAALAFPLADAQDKTFHDYLLKLREAVQPGAVAADQCAFTGAMVEKIRSACDECHRDYR